MSDRVKEKMQKKQDEKGGRITRGTERDKRKTNNPILSLQQKVGNKAVGQLLDLRAVQAKLDISQPDDGYEREADDVAERVMRIPDSAIWRKGKPPQVQRNVSATQSNEVGADIESRINAARGGGQPLTDNARAFFEPRFGEDFGDVRIHVHSEANMVSQSLQARAFTNGRDIFFKQCEYDPTGRNGRRLLAHELTHVIQQQSLNYRSNPVLQREEAGRARKQAGPQAVQLSRNFSAFVARIPNLQPRTGSNTFAHWFMDNWQTIFSNNPYIPRNLQSGAVQNVQAFDDPSTAELGQIYQICRQSGNLRTQDIDYLSRQRAQLQSHVDYWRQQHANAQSGFLGSSGSIAFVNSPEYGRFRSVMCNLRPPEIPLPAYLRCPQAQGTP